MKKRQLYGKKLFLVIPAILILAGGITYFYMRSHSDGTPDYQKGVARLEALENADISAAEKALMDLRKKDKENALAQVQEGITDENALLDDIEIRQVFQGSVILGDSITESIVEYGFLDTDVVVSKRGLSIAAADEQIETAIGLNPMTIFMAFGSNDLEMYEDDAAAFIEAYRVQIRKLQEALPDSPIYINGILPLTQAAIDAIPALGNYPQYNEALQEMCQELGCTYIDNSFIVADDASMYEPDGEHVIRDYYPKWLTYMAKTAGL